MLCIAVYGCAWLGARKLSNQGGNAQTIWDLSFWMFVFGILGARLFFVIQYHDQFRSWLDFFAVWEGGLVVYGSAIGGLFAFLWFTYRYRISRLWLADLIAPYMLLGVAIGRIGCLLNGCCYGDYCEAPWGISFPGGSGPQQRLVTRGHQTRLGFVVDPDDRLVTAVERGMVAEKAGLKAGDEILSVNGLPVRTQAELRIALLTAGVEEKNWDRVEEDANISMSGKSTYTLNVRRPSNGEQLKFTLRPSDSLPLHPTQLYSTISNFLMFLALAAYYPYRRHDGAVIALMAIGYSIYRFLVEFLRYDETPLMDGLTISQNISLLLFVGGIAVWIYSSRMPLHRNWNEAAPA